jgi:hypothetical protein
MFGNLGMGMYFGSMKTSESIEKKLKDPKTEIEDLLRDEDLLQEFRSQNEKVIDYFDRNKIKRLLDYIIKEPEVDEQEKGYKFPFLCSQIFGLEIDKIMKYFFITNKQIEEEQKEKEEKEKKEKKDSDDEEDNNENKEQDNNKKEENENIKKEEEKVENKEENKTEEEKERSKEEEAKKDEVKEEKKEEANEEKRKIIKKKQK